MLQRLHGALLAVLACVAASVCLAVPVAGAASAAPTATASASEASLLREMNRARVQNGVAPLHTNAALHRAAREYSLTMLRTNAFTHGNFAARISRYQVPGTVTGENLAWGTGPYGTARGIVAAWLASPGHRANLLRPGFRYVGIGAVTGTFAGVPGATVVTADFAGS